MFSRIYGAVINARNALYEKDVFDSVSLGVPVISIGNITVGGTGKTPLVALIAELLTAQNEKVCILTRGYGRENARSRTIVSDGAAILVDAKQAGDEPFELARRLLGKTVVIADANRSAAGIWAREKFGITAFVLDDAFQHRKVRRDLDIVCVDATNPFGNKKLLPSGILREPLENLKRADAIVITRANLAENIAELKLEISEYNPNCPLFTVENRISRVVELEEFHAEARTTADCKQRLETKHEARETDSRALAFCALGNPNNFFAQLRQENYRLISTQIYSDHYFYTPADAEKLSDKAQKSGAEVLLTTAKDAVKLKNLEFDVPCLVVESEMIFDDAIDFPTWLIGKIKAKSEN